MSSPLPPVIVESDEGYSNNGKLNKPMPTISYSFNDLSAGRCPEPGLHSDAKSSFGSCMSVSSPLVGSRQADVLVIGGGLSGLAAAYWVFKKAVSRAHRLSVCVVEASERLGGRCLSVGLAAGKYGDVDSSPGANVAEFDIGANWFTTNQRYLVELLDEFRLGHFEGIGGIEGDKKSTQLGSTKIKRLDTDAIATNIIDASDIRSAAKKLQNLAEKVNVQDPFLTPDAEILEQKSAATLFKKCCITQFARDALEASSLVFFGASASQISALYFLRTVKSLGGIDFLLGLSCGRTVTPAKAQPGQPPNMARRPQRIVGGTKSLIESLAEEIGLDNIYVNRPIQVIIQHRYGVTALSKSGFKFDAKYVIVAIPPGEMSKINWEPQLPLPKRRFMASAPQAPALSFIITYEEPFWRSKKQSGHFSGTGFRHGGKKPLPIIFTTDVSHDDKPALFGCINPEWFEETGQRRKDAVLADLVAIFGPEAQHYIEYVDKNWGNDHFIGGMSTYVPVGGMQHFIQGLREPLGNIHWAGTDTAMRFINTMSGAAEAGKRAAFEVLCKANADIFSSSTGWSDSSLAEAAELSAVDANGVGSQPTLPIRGYRSSFRLKAARRAKSVGKADYATLNSNRLSTGRLEETKINSDMMKQHASMNNISMPVGETVKDDFTTPRSFLSIFSANKNKSEQNSSKLPSTVEPEVKYSSLGLSDSTPVIDKQPTFKNEMLRFFKTDTVTRSNDNNNLDHNIDREISPKTVGSITPTPEEDTANFADDEDNTNTDVKKPSLIESLITHTKNAHTPKFLSKRELPENFNQYPSVDGNNADQRSTDHLFSWRDIQNAVQGDISQRKEPDGDSDYKSTRASDDEHHESSWKRLFQAPPMPVMNTSFVVANRKDVSHIDQETHNIGEDTNMGQQKSSMTDDNEDEIDTSSTTSCDTLTGQSLANVQDQRRIKKEEQSNGNDRFPIVRDIKQSSKNTKALKADYSNVTDELLQQKLAQCETETTDETYS